MATHFSCITEEQAALIRNASLFFVASADPQLAKSPEGPGPVNLSPKITVMVCSFEEGDAAIVRLYGKAKVTSLADSPIADRFVDARSESHKMWPMRDLIDIAIEATMTSCGYGVPVMSFVRDRRPVDRGRRYKPPLV